MRQLEEQEGVNINTSGIKESTNQLAFEAKFKKGQLTLIVADLNMLIAGNISKNPLVN